MLDKDYMKQALRLARWGLGKTSPNPMVGAVIVKGHLIISKGYHHRYGGKHAEINAIENAREDISGATLYVTLEPCCHYGKRPPCTEFIIKSKIRRVVVGIVDPNPVVRGKGIQKLREEGIEVSVGVLEEECIYNPHHPEQEEKEELPPIAEGMLARELIPMPLCFSSPACHGISFLRTLYSRSSSLISQLCLHPLAAPGGLLPKLSPFFCHSLSFNTSSFLFVVARISSEKPSIA